MGPIAWLTILHTYFIGLFNNFSAEPKIKTRMFKEGRREGRTEFLCVREVTPGKGKQGDWECIHHKQVESKKISLFYRHVYTQTAILRQFLCMFDWARVWKQQAIVQRIHREWLTALTMFSTIWLEWKQKDTVQICQSENDGLFNFMKSNLIKKL